MHGLLSQVIIDDSHLMNELSTLGALVYTTCQQVILFGDQLAVKARPTSAYQRTLFMRYLSDHILLDCAPHAMVGSNLLAAAVLFPIYVFSTVGSHASLPITSRFECWTKLQKKKNKC
jgi:hypothetical protein